jgi:hypothetical protein
MTANTWTRAPEHDKRFAWGDDWAGDAWRNDRTGELHWTVVGYDPIRQPTWDTEGDRNVL